MARKEFTYRGKNVEELQALSMDELSLLFPSSERRKMRRGFSKEEQNLLKKLAKRDRVKTHAREMIILPSMIGKTLLVHNGKEWIPVLVTIEMVAHRLGQFALTRKMTKHGSAGVGVKKEKKK